MPRYVILGSATVNGIRFLITNSINLLLFYRIVIDFYILTLYPTTLLYLLIGSNFFLIQIFYVDNHVICE